MGMPYLQTFLSAKAIGFLAYVECTPTFLAWHLLAAVILGWASA